MRRIVALSAICCFLVLFCGKAAIDWYLKYLDEIAKPSLAKLQSMQDHANAAQLQADHPHDYPLPDDLSRALDTPSDFRLYRNLANIPDSVRSAFTEAAKEETF